MNPKSRSRRTFLKQFSFGGSGVLLSPLLGQLAAAADGITSALPQRFVFLVKSSGLTPEAITPELLRGKKGTGSAPLRVSLKGATLPDSLRALESFKNQLAIVQGFSGKMCLAGHTS